MVCADPGYLVLSR